MNWSLLWNWAWDYLPPAAAVATPVLLYLEWRRQRACLKVTLAELCVTNPESALGVFVRVYNAGPTGETLQALVFRAYPHWLGRLFRRARWEGRPRSDVFMPFLKQALRLEPHQPWESVLRVGLFDDKRNWSDEAPPEDVYSLVKRGLLYCAAERADGRRGHWRRVARDDYCRQYDQLVSQQSKDQLQ